jgi:tRNA(adenine34) deaminase
MLDQGVCDSIMSQVINETKKTIELGQHPFVAFLVDEKGSIIYKAHNSQRSSNDRTAHAEVVLVRESCRLLKKFYLSGYSVFSVSEPCAMCTSLLIKAKIDAIYFGAYQDSGNDPQISAKEIISRANHQPQLYGGLLEEECLRLISSVRNF